MNYFETAALAVLGTLALTASASAAVVCNEDGDCWRTKERLTYPPEARVQTCGQPELLSDVTDLVILVSGHSAAVWLSNLGLVVRHEFTS
jgi:hypothetical protein